jgi:hypothetical protein
MISLLGRQNNKKILMLLLKKLIMERSFGLESIQSFFNRINRIYRQAGVERAQVKKMLEETN